MNFGLAIRSSLFAPVTVTDELYYPNLLYKELLYEKIQYF